MMAFFLLMWLISMTTKEQKTGLANYFAPPNVSPTTSGSGGILMGTAIDKAGSKASDARDAPYGARAAQRRDATPATSAMGQPANQSAASAAEPTKAPRPASGRRSRACPNLPSCRVTS